jgi:prepilin peptidase CpaA
MTLLSSAPAWLTIILFLLLAAAAAEDVWRLQIEDWMSALVALCAFLALAIDGPVGGIWENLLLFAVVLGIGTLLFARGWMGGGDVKLLAACALWFDLSQGWKMLVAVAVAGGLETLVVMILRSMPWPSNLRQQLAVLRRDEAIPYGVAIAAGMALAALSWR